MSAPSPTTLFRTRFPFVCDRCDLGYRAGRLAGWSNHHRIECATCLVGSDPDNDTTTTRQDRMIWDNLNPDTPPPSPTLFDS